MKMKNKTKRILFGILLIAITMSFQGCGSVTYSHIDYTGGNNYKTFVTPQGDKHQMSFEYPSDYRLGYQKDTTVAAIQIWGDFGFDSGKVYYIFISFDYYSSNALTSANKQISYIKKEWNRNFLLEKRKVKTQDGIDGWEIIMTYREKPIKDTLGLHARPPIFAVYREVFLDYEGIVWRIQLYADADSYKQIKQDFEHILKTLEVTKYASSYANN